MPKRSNNLLVELTTVPWWVSVIFAGIVFIGMKFVLPSMLRGPLFSGVARLSSSWALLVACVFLLPGVISMINAWQKGELLKSQTSLSSLLNLSWRAFEEVIGETYRRQGYHITENIGPGSDGGIDLVATKEGETVLIQCKHWKSRKIGVKTVREMFGLWNAERANQIHIVTSGDFTEEAKEFARGKPIKLINGTSLVWVINREQPLPVRANNHQRPKVVCPLCGSSMVVRTAKVGTHAGRQFWGCERFPQCRGIRPIQD